MSDDYGYWRAKLAGLDPDPPEDRTLLPCGFWRLRSGKPLAVWMVEGGARCAMVGFAADAALLSPTTMEEMAERGAFGAAVTEETYRDAFDRGHWPDSEGPTRDLMNTIAGVGNVLAEAAGEIGTKLALYPGHRLTKKLRHALRVALNSGLTAIAAYEATEPEKQNERERRDNRAA